MNSVMVVDDEAPIIRQLKLGLGLMGYEIVATASSGEDAIRLARQTRPDVILMDIVMPGKLDGIDASVIIRDELDIPVIFLTAFATDKFIDKAKTAKPFGYLLKPFHLDEVRATIEVAFDRMEHERKVNSSRRDLFKLSLDQSRTGWAFIDGGGRFFYANDVFARMHGYLPDEIEGRRIEGIYGREQANEFNRAVERIIRDGAVFGEYVNLSDRQGTVFRALIAPTTIKSDDGRTLFLAINTFRPEPEVSPEDFARRRDLTFYESASYIPLAVFELDRDGAVRYMNDAGVDLTGYTLCDVEAGLRFDDLFGEDERARAAKYFALLFRGENVVGREFVLKRADGTPRSVVVYASPVLEGDEIRRVRGIAIDVTERKLTEEALVVYSKKLEKTIHEKTRLLAHADRLSTLGTMVAKIVHEINNPLSVIMGNVQLVSLLWKNFFSRLESGGLHLDDDDRRTIAALQEFLADMQESSVRIGDIVSEMKQYSRREERTLSAAALHTLVAAAVRVAGPRLKRCRLEIDVPEGLLINCDPRRIEQVFVNLLSNSADADDGCRITIVAKREGGSVRIVYADDGPGIPPELRDKIFEPFFTTKSRHEGCGIGMTIVCDILREHGGGIRLLASERGAAFEIVLPFCDDGSAN